ncbi:OmpA family protein [Vibrio maerlii]|uniref:OmpA family protein n=1 Tax=Vibrio maerlii TaxID=2231648 RepID=UPI000E3EB808|nr:OmpA family protein [Vibrio maerlii]
MIRYKTLLTLSIATALVGCMSSEYDYIETPESNQQYDLLDDDRDGVVNARDFCPGTPEYSQVDNDGCGEVMKNEEVLQLKILFAHDSDEINAVFEGQISDMASFLKKYESASIEIQGFASRVGTSAYNLELSKRRAFNVQDSLLSHGIEPDRVRIVGFGDTIVVADGSAEVDHAQNRRVTATVVGLEEKVVEEWTIFTTKEK